MNMDIATAINNIKHYRVKNLRMLRDLTVDRLSDYTLSTQERTRHEAFLKALDKLIASKS